jgi:hypothetical protein
MSPNQMQPKKQTYHSPQVRDYGNIKKLTATNATGGAGDNGSGNRKT